MAQAAPALHAIHQAGHDGQGRPVPLGQLLQRRAAPVQADGLGKKPYNKDFFGFYKSHDDGTVNVANYQDKRFSVFQAKHKALGWGLSIAIAVSVAYLWNFFQPGDQDLKAAVQDAPKTEHAVTPAVSAPIQPQVVVATAPAKAEEPKGPPPIDYLDKLAQQSICGCRRSLIARIPSPNRPRSSSSWTFWTLGIV
ncbi:hypothetical protein ABRB19_12105 [Pseudomonas aeruginosa]